MRKVFGAIMTGAMVVALATPGFSQSLVSVFSSTSITDGVYIEHHAPSANLLIARASGAITQANRLTGAAGSDLAATGFTNNIAGLAVSETSNRIVAADTSGALAIYSGPGATPTSKALTLNDGTNGQDGVVNSIHLSGAILFVVAENDGAIGGNKVDAQGFNINGTSPLAAVTGADLGGGGADGVAATNDTSFLVIAQTSTRTDTAELTFDPGTGSISYTAGTAGANTNLEGVDVFEPGDNSVAFVGDGGFGRFGIDGDASAVAYAGFDVSADDVVHIDSAGAQITALNFDTGLTSTGGDVVVMAIPSAVQDWALY